VTTEFSMGKKSFREIEVSSIRYRSCCPGKQLRGGESESRRENCAAPSTFQEEKKKRKEKPNPYSPQQMEGRQGAAKSQKKKKSNEGSRIGKKMQKLEALLLDVRGARAQIDKAKGGRLEAWNEMQSPPIQEKKANGVFSHPKNAPGAKDRRLAVLLPREGEKERHKKAHGRRVPPQEKSRNMKSIN